MFYFSHLRGNIREKWRERKCFLIFRKCCRLFSRRKPNVCCNFLIYPTDNSVFGETTVGEFANTCSHIFNLGFFTNKRSDGTYQKMQNKLKKLLHIFSSSNVSYFIWIEKKYFHNVFREKFCCFGNFLFSNVFFLINKFRL